MNQPTEKQLRAVLEHIVRAGFNRSLGALVQAGAIDTKKLDEHYRGMGSKYYDLVSEQITYTAKYGAEGILLLRTQTGEWPPTSDTSGSTTPSGLGI